MWRALAGIGLVLALVAGCSASTPATPTGTAPQATATLAEASPTPMPDGPLRKTYARGETVDIERGVLFLDPKTGGGEAWADVRPSPSGMFVAWYGADGQQPPVLFETDTYRKIALDTGGQLGAVLDFSLDESEVSIKTSDAMLIASAETGDIRLRFPLDAQAFSARANWGPDGSVAVGSVSRDGAPLGFTIWRAGDYIEFADAPGANWGQFSPDGRLFVTSRTSEDGWTAIIDLETRITRRIDVALQNPRWSASGQYLAGQDQAGRIWAYSADGTARLRITGGCALLGPTWLGEEIPAYGPSGSLLVAMDGATRAYKPQPHSGVVSTFTNNGAALLDAPEGSRLAEVRTGQIPVSWPTSREGVHGTTADGRGLFLLGVGGRGWCEGAQEFKVELAPLPD